MFVMHHSPFTIHHSPLFHSHRHAARPGAERDARLRLDVAAGHEARTPAARERGEDEHGLRPREALADAAARAAAGAEVCGLRARGRGLGRPALGVEAHGVGPEARVALDDVPAGEDARAARDAIAADLVVSERATPAR